MDVLSSVDEYCLYKVGGEVILSIGELGNNW